MSFWLALQFLTILPTPRLKPATPSALGKSLSFYPLVGLILGGLLAALNYGLGYILPPLVSAVLLVGALALLTGAHHLDGLADTGDGMTAGKSKEERLELMSAPGVGAFGIVGVVIVVLLKAVTLSTVLGWPALVVMPIVGRWLAVGALCLFPYAKAEGMGRGYKLGSRWYDLVLATATAALAAWLVFGWAGLVVVGLTAALMYGFAAYLKSKLGGLTGDSYGAVIEISEVIVLLLLCGKGVVFG